MNRTVRVRVVRAVVASLHGARLCAVWRDAHLQSGCCFRASAGCSALLQCGATALDCRCSWAQFGRCGGHSRTLSMHSCRCRRESHYQLEGSRPSACFSDLQNGAAAVSVICTRHLLRSDQSSVHACVCVSVCVCPILSNRRAAAVRGATRASSSSHACRFTPDIRE